MNASGGELITYSPGGGTTHMGLGVESGSSPSIAAN
jgi:hypothetical protein